jgi:hypothetical protein
MQLSRYLQEAVVDTVFAALVLFGGLQVLEALWAYVLRTRTARRLRMVEDHRTLLQRRGERMLGWLVALVWVAVALRNVRVLDPLMAGARQVLGAEATIGSLTLSLGAALAFAITIWLSFVASRLVRFLLAEDVYPRLDLAAPLTYPRCSRPPDAVARGEGAHWCLRLHGVDGGVCRRTAAGAAREGSA